MFLIFKVLRVSFRYEFDQVVPGFTGFYWVLLGFAEFYRILPGFTGFYWVFLGFIGFHWALLVFTGFF